VVIFDTTFLTKKNPRWPPVGTWNNRYLNKFCYSGPIFTKFSRYHLRCIP